MIYSKELHAAVVARLTQLAQGAKPRMKYLGICHDIDRSCDIPYGPEPHRPGGYGYCASIFRGMGLDPDTPIPTDNRFLKWEGQNALDRQELCKAMIRYIETTYLGVVA